MRSMPTNTEAERAVIGSVLLDNLMLAEVSEQITAKDFHSEANRFLFESMESLSGTNTPMDLLTIAEDLKRRSLLDRVGGPAYLQLCADTVPTAANAAHYAKIVRDKSMLRRTIMAATEIAHRAYDQNPDEDGGDGVDDLLDWAENEIFTIAETRTKGGVHRIDEVVKKTLAHIDALAKRKGDITGVATGFTELDNMTAGLQDSELVILAARPSVGKTALALNIARNAAVYCPALVLSLEMSRQALGMRLFSTEAEIDSSKLRRGYVAKSDWPKLTGAAQLLEKLPLYIDDSSNPTTLEIKAKARRVKAEHGLGIIIIDYLQLIKPRAKKGANREQEISQISRDLKAMAKELEVPVLALAQLNRATENRPDSKPRLSDLRESGAIEQDSDVIMFLWRDMTSKKKDETVDDSLTELIIGKQRNGPTGTIKLTWRKQITKFENFSFHSEPPPSEESRKDID